ncbi:MAG: tetratricopeptide repeat protein [Motiliproteus sp.]|nr:tetratricopeptide repeat protein [Motiliproteus sp.]MCW9051214.1 tetratricopeptide repeat protein [Motiliproteus sp.]
MLPLHNQTRRLLSLLTIASLALSGCANRQSTPTTAPATQTPVDQASSEMEQLPKSDFQPATLYALLVGEMAANRGLPRVTLHNYLQEAERTQDIGIIKRSVQLASQLRDAKSMLKATMLWAEAEPNNPTPYRIATKELINRGMVDKALPMLDKTLKLGSLDVVDALTSRVQKMKPEERQSYLIWVDQQLVLDSNNAVLPYIKGALLSSQSELDQALLLTQQALEIDPDFERAILLEADLQSRTGHLDTALSHLREELADNNSKQMRTLYTRLLLEKKQFPLAEKQVAQLVKDHPQDNSLHFYLGVLLLEHNQLESSASLFASLAERTGSNSAISYYQGRIAQLNKQTEQALEFYQQVQEAPYLLASYTEIGKLLDSQDQPTLSNIFARARQAHPDSNALFFALEAAWLVDHDFDQIAMDLLNDGVEQHPKNTRLRYSRAMLGEKMGDMTLLESDLRYLLELEPNNATALNALGYSLTDNTDRHQEAIELIDKALRLKPDDPAILDSMGWAYYHLGDLPLSLQYLQKAFHSFPDPEIAAHLGTVHWALGNKNEAMKIWQEALEQHPENQYIIDAMEAAGKGI